MDYIAFVLSWKKGQSKPHFDTLFLQSAKFVWNVNKLDDREFFFAHNTIKSNLEEVNNKNGFSSYC